MVTPKLLFLRRRRVVAGSVAGAAERGQDGGATDGAVIHGVSTSCARDPVTAWQE